jgi:hypothetical protein
MNDPLSYCTKSSQEWRRDYELMRAAADVGLARHTAKYAINQQKSNQQWQNRGRMQHLQQDIENNKESFSPRAAMHRAHGH